MITSNWGGWHFHMVLGTFNVWSTTFGSRPASSDSLPVAPNMGGNSQLMFGNFQVGPFNFHLGFGHSQLGSVT